MPLDPDELRSLTRRDLFRRARDIRGVVIGATVEAVFRIANIRAGAAELGISDWLTAEVWPHWKKCPVLYVISANSVETATAIENAFPAAQGRNLREYARCQKNNRSGATTTLYVGSSLTAIKLRLKQHLWQGPVGTYAMHTHRWAEQINAPADGAVLVRIRKVTDPNGLGLTQNLEDALWRELRPMFGKLGGK